MKILCVGPIWRGSNAGGLFRAMSRSGALIDIIDEFYYISLHASNLAAKVIQKAVRSFQIQEFNKAIIASIELFRPDVLFVYKGRFVTPDTLEYAKRCGIKLALFYPDVSMKAHGKYIPLCIPLYDIIFTTKTFGIIDLSNSFKVTNAYFIPHGLDPDIHRKIDIKEDDLKVFGCDVSFIGTYSPKKEKLLVSIKKRLPDVNLKIWGGQWEKSREPLLAGSLQRTTILGDMYAIAIQCSKINLGILNERVAGASSGDLITSRTFHIPGSSGFMLHERNEESLLYFEDGVEAGFFDGAEDLPSQVQFYLENDAIRDQVRLAGHARAVKDHLLDRRASVVLRHFVNMV